MEVARDATGIRRSFQNAWDERQESMSWYTLSPMRKPYSRGLAISVALLFGSGCASAGQILLTFAGTITESVDNTLPISLLGQPFSGSLSYNSNDPINFVTSAPLVTTLYSMGPLDFLTLTIDDFTFSASGNAIGNRLAVEYHQINGAEYDYFEMSADARFGSSISSNFPGFMPTILDFSIAGVPGLLPAPGLPQNFDFNDVVSAGLGGRPTYAFVGSFDSMGSPVDVFWGNQFTSLQVQSAPEPAVGGLLAAGLIGLALIRKYGSIGKV